MVGQRNFDFELYFLGKVVLDKEKKIACSVIKLLDERSLLKKFKKFLSSPYVSPDTKTLPELFQEIEKKTGDYKAKRLRLDSLVMKHYPKASPERANARLKSLLAGLERGLQKFMALELLEDQPIELDRLKAKALLNMGEPRRFSTALHKWRQKTEKLPEGRTRRFHRWEIAKLDHFNFDMEKNRRQSVFPIAWQHFQAFIHTERLVYDNERLTYERIEEKPPLTDSGFEQSTFDTLLQTILHLQEGNCKSDELYFQAKEQFLQLAEDISDDEALTVLLTLQNCVTARHKLGKGGIKKEYHFWNQFFMRRQLENCYRGSLSRYTYLNRLQMAFFCKDMEMALDIISRYLPLLPADIRPAVKRHGEIALLFYNHDYQGVLDALNQLPLALPVSGQPLDAIADGTRFRSFAIRANLVLFAQDQIDYDGPHAALERYRKYLKSSGKTGEGRKRAEYLKPFEKYSRQILNTLNGQRYREERKHLIKTIKNAPPFHAKAWLLEYLHDLKRFPQQFTTLQPGR